MGKETENRDFRKEIAPQNWLNLEKKSDFQDYV
jgi:hypothetical protein